MRVRVPAKINLLLHVGPLRADGYHEIATVLQAVSLYDVVTAAPASGLTCTVTGEGADLVPAGQGNLAVTAAGLLARRAGRRPDVALTVEKSIPVAAGLAGGSADAAGALVACDALWGLGMERSELLGLAAELGSDVPFSLHGGTALGTGRGERLAEVMARGSYSWVLGFASEGLSTPTVYRERDRQPRSTSAGPEAVLAALRAADARALGAALHNDLQAPALRLRPALRRVLDAGAELGAVGGIVSGSGPTVALLARDQSAATALAASLAGLGLCRGVRVAHGPVSGARVVPG